jgi:hypothetical protein
MPTELARTIVPLPFEQANWLALHSPSKGRIVDLNIQDCAYCGEPALASSVRLITADAKGQAATESAPHSIRVNLSIHLCNRHAVRKRRKKGSSAGSVGLMVSAIGYVLLNLFGISNGIPFFSGGNLVWVVLVGILVMIGSTVIAEALGRLFKPRSGDLPPAVLVTADEAGNLEYSFHRAECAQQLEALLAPSREAVHLSGNSGQ